MEADPSVRIAIDVTPALRQRAGIGRYSAELARALLARGAHEYVCFVADRAAPGRTGALWRDQPSPADRGEPLPQPPTTVTTHLPARLHAVVWHRWGVRMPAEWWTGPIDLFHATDFLAPPLRHAKNVVTVHDLSFLRHPECADPRLAGFLGRTVPRAVHRSAHVVADSDCTRRDLVELLGVDPDKVTVAYPGVGDAFRRVADPDQLGQAAARYGLDRPFILGVGTLEPRKSWPVLIGAYRRLMERGIGADGSVPALVLAGGHGWRTGAIETAARRAQADGLDVRLLGFVPDADLPALYSLAAVFAYPSRYEGFGLPPLEALACGTPTVVANHSSLPEVVGDAALTVPHEDVEALATALARLLTDAPLRAELATRGPIQAARFSWSACAAAVETAFARAGEAPSPQTTPTPQRPPPPRSAQQREPEL